MPRGDVVSQWNKLVKQIKQMDRNMRFENLSKALIQIGYSPKQPRSGSSHVTFRKKGKRPITVPKDTPVNIAYIELVRDAIIEFESEGTEND
jgi:hypothetical protein